MRRLSIIIFSLLIVTSSVLAEDWTSIGEPNCTSTPSSCHYIDANVSGGSNDGSSWANAWSSISSASFTRGHKYYVADGNYGGFEITTAINGSTYIFLKKAISSDHGSSTGWSSGMGDGVSTITGQIKMSTSFFVFDGQVGGGPDDWDGSTNAHGFNITYRNDGYIVTTNGGSPWDNPRSYLKLYHIKWTGNNDNSDDFIGVPQNCTFAYNYHYKSGRTSYYTLSDASSNVWEYNYFQDHTQTSDGSHNENFSLNDLGSGNIIRYNRFYNWKSGTGPQTGVIVMKGDDSGVTTPDFKIYGNIFHCDNSYNCLVTNGIITDTSSSGGTINDILIYNNTFYNTGISNTSFISFAHNGGGHEFRNNIVIDSDAGYSIPTMTRTNNLYDNSTAASADTNGQYWSSGATALFNGVSTYDFTLKTPTENGYDVSAYLTEDMLGNTYGSDTVWDRGAYEFVSNNFSFWVTTDPHGYPQSVNSYDAIDDLGGASDAFVVVTGDLTHSSEGSDAEQIAIIRNSLGASYSVYPGIGNHELPGDGDGSDQIAWLESFDRGTINSGPGGDHLSYSWDYGNSHFVMLNLYYNSSCTEVQNYGSETTALPSCLTSWLQSDLAAATTAEHVFVFGHAPIHSRVDSDTGDAVRHSDDDLKDKSGYSTFLSILTTDGRVIAYFSGHEHNYSTEQISGIWDINNGHARGYDLGYSEVTVSRVTVASDGSVTMNVYRDNDTTAPWNYTHDVTLKEADAEEPAPVPAVLKRISCAGCAIIPGGE